jgi:signal transduction histidine kinase
MGPQKRRKVLVRARADATVVRVEVEDTGPGIPRDLQDVIFEPFVRGTHTEVGGTGLGLATAKRLVESHGGAIGVSSAVGVGSLFWIEMPLAAPGAIATRGEPEPHHISS